MLNRQMITIACLVPTELLAYVDKYNPHDGGSGQDFVWYIVIGGIILLINLFAKLFGRRRK